MLKELFCFQLQILVNRIRVVLDVLHHQLVDPFFLGTVKHRLVDRFSQENFSKSANRIFWVGFVKNFNEVFGFKDFKYV
jgi:hypothetical protein